MNMIIVLILAIILSVSHRKSRKFCNNIRYVTIETITLMAGVHVSSSSLGEYGSLLGDPCLFQYAGYVGKFQ